MTWTSEKPTVAGWYWMRAPKCGWRDCVVWVDKDEDGFYIDVGDCDSEYVMDIEAEWLGPITPDSYQHGRAAGARECVEKVRARAALWRAHGGAKIGFPCGHLTVEGECDSIADELGKFAQQAQDEKGVGNANIKMS